MGSCGCGDFSGGLRFPGPDGVVYVLEVYLGCDGCHTPAGVVIHRHLPTAEQRFWFEHEPSMPFTDWRGRLPGEPEYDPEYQSFHQPIFDPDKGIERLVKEMGSAKLAPDEAYELVGHDLEDNGREALDEAIRDTVTESDKRDRELIARAKEIAARKDLR